MSMFNKFFGRSPPDAQESRLPEERLRAIEGSSSADLAAEMLTAPSALMQLTHDEARVVVTYMRPHKIAEGVTFIKEGDTEDTDFSDSFAEGSSSADFTPRGAGKMAALEHEWSGMTVAMVAVSSIALVVGAMIGVDLLGVVYSNGGPANQSVLISAIGGLFQ